MFLSVLIISLYNPLLQCFETPGMEPGIFTFSRACFNLVSKQLKRSDLVNSLHVSVCSVSIIFLYNPLFQCFETPEMGPDIFTFSRACFNLVSKQLKRSDLVNSLHVSVHSVSIIFLYNPLFQCFETPEMVPGIFTFFRACFNFVETTETFGLSQFSSCFSPFQFFPL